MTPCVIWPRCIIIVFAYRNLVFLVSSVTLSLSFYAVFSLLNSRQVEVPTGVRLSRTSSKLEARLWRAKAYAPNSRVYSRRRGDEGTRHNEKTRSCTLNHCRAVPILLHQRVATSLCPLAAFISCPHRELDGGGKRASRIVVSFADLVIFGEAKDFSFI